MRLRGLTTWQTIGWLIALCVVCVALAGRAEAQVVKFTAATTTGAGSVTPVLSWCTETTQSAGATCGAGPATSCTASGDWTGTKAASGTETLPAVTSSRTYNLTCSWPAQSSLTFTWTAPTTNTDGSALTTLAGFRIYVANSAAGVGSGQMMEIANPAARTGTVASLAAGTWYGALTAYNTAGVESGLSSPIVSKVLAAGSATQAVGITVNAKPNPPTGVTIH